MLLKNQASGRIRIYRADKAGHVRCIIESAPSTSRSLKRYVLFSYFNLNFVCLSQFFHEFHVPHELKPFLHAIDVKTSLLGNKHILCSTSLGNFFRHLLFPGTYKYALQHPFSQIPSVCVQQLLDI